MQRAKVTSTELLALIVSLFLLASIAALVVFIVTRPANAAEPIHPAPPTYSRGLIFAFIGSECPNGSERLADEVYQKAGSISGVTYCTFRSMHFLYPGACPSGFRETGTAEHAGKRLHECSAEAGK